MNETIKLIADSGSTKTDWCLIRGESRQHLATQGINPFHQPEQEIGRILREELRPLLPASRIDAIHFYGAGCTAEKSRTVGAALRHAFPHASAYEVADDMLGAARALCGHEAGIACILGTGSNSCYYDGQQIRLHVPPLGYILGDEGSGAALGKRLAGDCLKGQLPEPLCRKFMERFALTQEAILDRVYRSPLPNRFLAGLSPFLHEHRQEPAVHRLLVESFTGFIRRNLSGYPAAPLHFTGSIAAHYAEELNEAAKGCGLSIASILPHPIEGLIAYHLSC